MRTLRLTTTQLTHPLQRYTHPVSVTSSSTASRAEAYPLAGTSGGKPSATGATGGGSSGGVSSQHSLPDLAGFGLLTLISGFVVAL